MANIGSEVEWALNWKARQNDVYFRAAFERVLELMEPTRMRVVLCDTPLKWHPPKQDFGV